MGAVQLVWIEDITLSDSTYVVQTQIDRKVIVQTFLLYKRGTESYYEIPFTGSGENQAELFIDMDKMADFFAGGDAFDLFLVEGENLHRVKCIGKIYPVFPFREHELIFPAATNYGNLSFYRQEKFVYAGLTDVRLTVDGVLKLQGIVGMYPKETFSVWLGENSLEAECEEISSLSSDRIVTWQRFTVEVDVKPWIGREQKGKVYVRTGRGDECRVKAHDPEGVAGLRRRVKDGRRKSRVEVELTKKAKYISVEISTFHVVKSAKNWLRSTWVEVRRSKTLLKMFTFAFYLLGRILPVQKNLVIFESFHGKQYSDNPRAIYEYMKKHYPDYRLIWSFDRRHIGKFKDKELQVVRRFTVRWLLLMTRANYWVTNARLPLWIPKPDHTIYVQTWHGTPLKRLACDMEEVHMPGTNTEKYKENFAKEAAKWDYLVSPNRYSTDIFRRAFRFQGEMIESGYPRNDFLSEAGEADVLLVMERLGMDAEKKVILYAPTWRDNQFYRKGSYKFRLELDLEKMREAFGETHVVVLRLHYLVAENLDLSGLEGFVYDGSAYEDIRDLYVVADMLVTDYSSVFFDYANLRRPMFFFVYDIEDYRDHLRGFYFDFEREAPGPLTKTTDELIAAIQQDDFVVDESFYQQFCYLEDGHATKRVVEAVFEE